MQNKIKIALAQTSPVFLNIDLSVEKACEIINEASKNNCQIIAFPETWLPGYPVWLDNAPKSALWDYENSKEIYKILYKNSISINDKYFNKLLELAKNNKQVIIIGANEKVNKTLYNSIIFFDSSGDFKIHRKLVPTYTERLVWGRGDGSGIITVKKEFGNIGGLICWEHWMPLLKATMYALNEVFHISQWTTINNLHLLASQNYAFEGNCFVGAIGSILTKKQAIDGLKSLDLTNNLSVELIESIEKKDNDYLMSGGSCFIKPNSELLTEQIFFEEKIIYQELNLDEIIEHSLVHDADGHYSRPDIFNLKVNRNKLENIS